MPRKVGEVLHAVEGDTLGSDVAVRKYSPACVMSEAVTSAHLHDISRKTTADSVHGMTVSND